MDRYNYYKRNIFWSLVVEMVQRGRSANEVIDKMHQTYGYKTSVTKIIKILQEDKKIITDCSSEFFFSHPAFPSDKITFFSIY